MQEAVVWAVLPGLEQAARLGRHDGLWDEDALGPVGRAGRVEHHAGVAAASAVGGILEGDASKVWRGRGRERGAEVLGEFDVLGGVGEGQRECFLGLGGEASGGEEEERLAVVEDVL